MSSAVYFIQEEDGGAVKIGHAADPFKRLHDLQIGNSRWLTLVAVVWTDCPKELETHYHAELRSSYLRGEWFAATPAVLAAIEQARTDPPPATKEWLTDQRLRRRFAARKVAA